MARKDLSDITPTAPTGGFYAYFSAAGSFVNATKAPFNTEFYDVNGWFDTTNRRYVPQVAGYYELHCHISGGNFGVAAYARADVLKSGTIALEGEQVWSNHATFGMGVHVSGVVLANGTTDYFEVFTYTSAGAATTGGASTSSSRFWGQLLMRV